MFKRLLAALPAWMAISALAADANTASQADLEAIKGIGPTIATKIIDGRKQGGYKDWPDLVGRVPGIGNSSAGKLSAGGLTVNGASYAGVTGPNAKSAVAAPAASAATPAPFAVEKK